MQRRWPKDPAPERLLLRPMPLEEYHGLRRPSRCTATQHSAVPSLRSTSASPEDWCARGRKAAGRRMPRACNSASKKALYYVEIEKQTIQKNTVFHINKLQTRPTVVAQPSPPGASRRLRMRSSQVHIPDAVASTR